MAPPPAEPTPSPAQNRKADKIAHKNQQAEDKAEHRVEQQKAKAEAKLAKNAATQAPQPVRQPVLDAPVTATLAPETPPAAPAPAEAPAMAAPLASTGDADAGSAIIVFANVSGAHCGNCETTKISVASSGKILIERGHGAEESWRYRRSVAHVRPERAAAFAARLATMRPTGKQVLSCPAAQQGDGLTVEWIGAERHDVLSVPPGCAGPSIAALLHAPDLLGLSQLTFPWGSVR